GISTYRKERCDRRVERPASVTHKAGAEWKCRGRRRTGSTIRARGGRLRGDANLRGWNHVAGECSGKPGELINGYYARRQHPEICGIVAARDKQRNLHSQDKVRTIRVRGRTERLTDL